MQQGLELSVVVFSVVRAAAAQMKKDARLEVAALVDVEIAGAT